MITTYRLHVNDLTPAVIDSIKAAFRDKTIEIIVAESSDETTHLLANEANRRRLFESMDQLERGEGVEMTVSDFLAKYSTKP